jgi:[pyruvate, water dikinase]-phosphate phosphotransferase / [pyruvate, water dikinase] kinase
MNYIFIVSDGTGRTAKQNLKAALTQFCDVDIQIETRSDVRTEEQVLQVVHEAARVNGLIIHTLVSQQHRLLLDRIASLQNVRTLDLMGPLLHSLADHFSNVPSETPGLFSELNEAYFRRIEAIEFAFHHDDGQRSDELSRAEIILIGVSRTFKTPISIYLAFKGWFVANIPIIEGIELPTILHEVPAKRIFCLITDPVQLAALRKVRNNHLKGATGQYATLDYVQHEIHFAQSIFNKHPQWARIEVTNKPIEEIASEILARIKNY